LALATSDRNSFELVDLFGHTSAETVEDGTDSAHEREDTPEKRSPEDMGYYRLRMRQQQYSPGNQVSAGDDADMSEHEGAYPGAVETKEDQRTAYQGGDDPGDVGEKKDTQYPQNAKDNA